MPSILDLARLSLAVYRVPPSPGSASREWERTEVYGAQSAYFSACLFRSVQGSEYVLAYRGMDHVADVPAVAALLLGLPTAQYVLAERCFLRARAASARHGGTAAPAVYLTGHSLGGSLASMVGARFDVPVVTFNAPGAARAYAVRTPHLLSSAIDLWSGDDAKRILHVRAKGDVASLLAGPALGKVVRVPRPSCAPEPAPPDPPAGLWRSVSHSVAALRCVHSMQGLLRVLEQDPSLALPLAAAPSEGPGAPGGRRTLREAAK